MKLRVGNPFATTRGAVITAAVAVIAAAGIVAGVLLSGSPRPAITTTPPTTAGPAPTRPSVPPRPVRAVHPPRTTTTTVPHRHRPQLPKGMQVAPLTGWLVPAAVARRPAVVIKIDNISQALPQTGVNQADVVYEELVEGGLTRLAAVYQSDYPSRVEPVRSGRLTDEGIADDLNHPVLAYAGTNGIFAPILAAQPLDNISMAAHPGLFSRDPNRLAPHNVYVSVPALAATDHPAGPPPGGLFAWRKPGTPLRGAGVRPAAHASIPFPAAAIRWSWDPATKRWLRTQDGAPDCDTSGARLSASNVLIQFLPYVTSAYATGEGLPPTPIPKGKMVGKGSAWLLSGGALVKGTWSRRSLISPTVYRDGAGQPFRLAPGRTWIELPPDGTKITVIR
ncbi:MAG TPA: DUF3048 domain-containing protein [Acidimicrobiales bacterium]|nr:DUF3048 domain-containing protein [Acidimicrobiales bacterium]